MLRQNILMFYRNIKRNKSTFFINLTGFSMGLACSVLLLLWVKDELSYDRFHENTDNLFRITADISELRAAVTPAPLSEALEMEIPGVHAARLSYGIQNLFKTESSISFEKRGFFADPSFLQLFSFPLVKGDGKLPLTRPHEILITEALADKYFGDEEAIGKTILLNNKDIFEISGILKNIPQNSHLQFDYLLPMAFLAKTDTDLIDNIWDNFSFYTYIQVDEKISKSPENLNTLVGNIEGIFQKNETNLQAEFTLQPIKKIHLHSNYIADVAGHGNNHYVRIFSFAAIFILLVACINFMNLATAQSSRRAKEVGLRKINGANRTELVLQFFMKSILFSFLAIFLALFIVVLLLPSFNNFSGKTIHLDLLDDKLIYSLFTIALLTGLISGSYPAIFLSAFQPLKVLEGVFKIQGGNVSFRNALVIVQLVISMLLIVATIVIYNQLRFLQSQNLGFDKENLLYLQLSGDRDEYYRTLKSELQQDPLTSSFTLLSDLPTQLGNGTTAVDWEGKDPFLQYIFPNMTVDENFSDVFKMEFATGRGFDKDFKSDREYYIINETALQIMGMNADNTVGQSLSFFGRRGNIIGVVKDFNFEPLHESIEPLIITYEELGELIVIKAQPGETEATISSLEGIWKRTNPSYPFTYSFVDQDLAKLYQTE